MLNKKFNYVYLITNKINGKKYIGDHSTDIFLDSYIGSGKYLKSAIKKYGRENFKKEILETFSSKQEAFNAQEKYIKKYNTVIPFGYNISPFGGFQNPDGWSLESREKISKANKGKTISEETKLKISKANFGKKRSQETIDKLKGPKSLETKLKMSKSAKERLIKKENHPMFGKCFSFESKEKMSRSHRGKILAMEHKFKIGKGIRGSRNPMYGISLKDKWIEKYGIERGNEKYFQYKEKLSKSSRWKNKIL